MLASLHFLKKVCRQFNIETHEVDVFTIRVCAVYSEFTPSSAELFSHAEVLWAWHRTMYRYSGNGNCVVYSEYGFRLFGVVMKARTVYEWGKNTSYFVSDVACSSFKILNDYSNYAWKLPQKISTTCGIPHRLLQNVSRALGLLFFFSYNSISVIIILKYIFYFSISICMCFFLILLLGLLPCPIYIRDVIQRKVRDVYFLALWCGC